VKSFLEYSHKIGSNFLLCQGPGGNTSFKVDNKIFIKKSGFHLKDSKNKNIFEEVDLKKIKYHYKTTKSKKYSNSLSIETPLHVLLNSNYVFHYHSLASVLLSLIFDKEYLDKFLVKNELIPISYMRPGLKLANEIVKMNQDFQRGYYFLYNHGVVLEGNNLTKIYKDILRIEKIFGKLIDYQLLKKTSQKILKSNLEGKKFKNPNPNIDYLKYAGKYFFPDHAVFFPKFFKFDHNYLYFEKKLNNTELQYFKSVLILLTVLSGRDVKNFISNLDGDKLLNSKDELLRKKLNI